MWLIFQNNFEFLFVTYSFNLVHKSLFIVVSNFKVLHIRSRHAIKFIKQLLVTHWLKHFCPFYLFALDSLLSSRKQFDKVVSVSDVELGFNNLYFAFLCLWIWFFLLLCHLLNVFVHTSILHDLLIVHFLRHQDHVYRPSWAQQTAWFKKLENNFHRLYLGLPKTVNKN